MRKNSPLFSNNNALWKDAGQHCNGELDVSKSGDGEMTKLNFRFHTRKKAIKNGESPINFEVK